MIIRYPQKYGYIFFLLLFLTSLGKSQEFNITIQHWGVEDGLLHREINALHQDSRGFIWIGTPFGLNRFDGYSFEWWTPVKDNLEVGNIYYINEDKNGFLWLFSNWVHAQPKIDLFNPITEEVFAFEAFFKDQIDFDPLDITGKGLFLESGTVVLSTKKAGTIIIIDKEGKLSLFQFPFKENIRLLASSKKNTIWFIQGERILSEADLNGNILHSYTFDGEIVCEEKLIRSNESQFLIYDKRKESDITYYLIEIETGERKVLASGDFELIDYVVKLELKPSFVSNPIKGWNIVNFERIYDENENELFDLLPILEKNNVFSRELLIDHKGRIWYGGNFGLFVINVQKNQFKNYLNGSNVEDLLAKEWNSTHAIRGITGINDDIIVNGEFSSTYRINLQSGEKKVLSSAKINYNNFIAAKYHPKGEFWIGNQKTVNVYAQDWNHIKSIDLEHDPWSFYWYNKDTILIGSNSGLIIYDTQKDLAQKYPGPNKLETFIYHIEKDKNGLLWIASGNGMYSLNLKENKIQRYASEEEAPYYLPAKDFQHFHIDEDGIFWIATRGNGLIQFSPTNHKHKQYTRSDGLSHNVIYAVYEDSNGFLWLPSDYGLIRFEKATGNTWTYTTKDGIIHNEFNRIAHFQAPDGRLFFGTIDGVTTLNPKELWDSDATIYSPLVITNYQRYNGEEETMEDLTPELLKSNTIVLNPSNDFCTLNFALLEFTESDKINYAYQIEGLQEEWIGLSEGKLRLSNLPYGDYTLRIKGQSSNGKWSDQEISLNLEVTVPFYQQGLFLGLSVLTLFAVIALVLLLRIRLQKRQNVRLEKIIEERTEQIRRDKQTIEQQAEELKELDQLKTRFFNNISHELRTPLTLIIEPIRQLIQSHKNTKVSQQLQIPLNNSKKLLELVNQLLDLSKMENQKMQLQLKRHAIDTQMENICKSFLPLASRKQIQLNFSSERNIPLAYWDVSNMERIAYNLLSNALKFTENNGQIDFTLSYKAKQDALVIKCKDTGIGIPEDQIERIFDRFHQVDDSYTRKNEGTGIGLSFVKELTELMGGTIEVQSNIGTGTTFVLTYPLVKSLNPVNGVKIEKNKALIENGKSLSHAATNGTNLNGKQDHQQQILITEDNEELRQFIKSILPKQYEVMEASNGRIGLEMALEKMPDLIICDIMMPEMDGYELCNRLKTDTLTSHIPIIMLTAKATLDNKLQGLKTGADAYLTKPFHTEELVVRVEKLIETRQLLKEKFSKPGWITKKKEVNSLSDLDKDLITRVDELILTHLGEETFSVEQLAKEVHMSRSQLFRKFKSIIGKTPNAYIRECRLRFAMELIQKEKMPVIQLADRVGFKDERYFSSKFKEYFGMSPSEVV